MSAKKKDPWTKEEMAKRLFPKEVVEAVKDKVNPKPPQPSKPR